MVVAVPVDLPAAAPLPPLVAAPALEAAEAADDADATEAWTTEVTLLPAAPVEVAALPGMVLTDLVEVMRPDCEAAPDLPAEAAAVPVVAAEPAVTVA